VQRRNFLSGVAGTGIASGLGVLGTDDVRAIAATVDPLAFDSTASLLDANGEPLTDDALVPVWAESSASNTDSDGNGDATTYPNGTDIPLVAVDEPGSGAVVGIGCPLVPNDTDFKAGNEEFLLNVFDRTIGSGTVLWDDGHGQFYQLDSSGNGGNGPGFAQFEAYAERNGYRLESTTDVAADLGGADALVVTSPSEAFTSAEESAVADFVANGGVLFLLSQSDFRDFDQTANSNALAAAVDARFRFNDDQVVDASTNNGAEYVPLTANFNTADFAGYFENRPGIDEANALDPSKTYTVDVVGVSDGDTVDVQFDDGRVESIRVLGVDTAEKKGNGQYERPEEWEGLADGVGLTDVQFGTACSLLDADGERLTDDSVVAVWAEESATNTDADGNDDAVDYGAHDDIPLLGIDGNVVAVGSLLVDDDTLQYNADCHNEELLLNVWDQQLGDSGTVVWDETHNQYNGLGGFSTFADYAGSNGYTVRPTSDVAADLGDADGVVIPSPSESYTNAELDALASFVDAGGSVFLHDRADYDDYDATSDLNAVADALRAAFRFNDDQVLDESSNTGAPFRPVTGRFNPDFDVFEPRGGVGADLVVGGDGEPVSRLVFGEGAAPLLDANGDPLTDGSSVAVWAESSAVVQDGDGNGDAVTYTDGTDVPLVARDASNAGTVVGFPAPIVADGYDASADNEEFVLNVWTDVVGDGGVVRWDESHGQYYSLEKFSGFAAYAEDNGFEVEAGSQIPSDTTDADALVVTSPGSFSESELAALESFVDAGGAVFLHDQDDYNDYDQTGNLNAIASAIGLSFRFADAQVIDEDENAGVPFAPATSNFNDGAFGPWFATRQGVDDVEEFWSADYPYLAYHAELATQFATDALAGETVDISFDPVGSEFNDGVKDPFGRVLAYIEYDDGSGSRDTLYNRQLVEEGYARSYASSLSTLESFQTAEYDARDAGNGIWANSNPNLTPTIRNASVEDVYVPKAVAVETTRGRLNGPFAPVRASRSASKPGAPLVGLDPNRNLAVVGGLVVDEGYEQAEGFDEDTSEYGNFAFLANVMDGLGDRTEGRVLVEGGHGQFNASAGLSAEDVAYFQRYLEGFDVDLAGVNDVTSDALDDARAILVTTPVSAFTDAEVRALYAFAADGGAVVLATGATATPDQRANLNEIASTFGSTLRVSDTAVTDATNNLAGDETLPTTTNFGPDPWGLREPFHANGDMGCGRVETTDRVTGELDGWHDSESFTYTTDLRDPCSVEISLAGPSDADFDLYVTTSGRRPTTAFYDAASTSESSTERVVVDAVTDADELGILVDAYGGSGEFTLTVTETGA
jgi:endonuclease YncB( thermonuclease family)